MILILIGMIVCEFFWRERFNLCPVENQARQKPRFAEANFQEANWPSWEMYLLDTDLNSLQNQSPVFSFRVFVKERNT